MMYLFLNNSAFYMPSICSLFYHLRPLHGSLEFRITRNVSNFLHGHLIVLCFVKFRCQYLSNAVLQAKNATNSDGLLSSTRGSIDSGFLDLLEGKLAVLRFQIKIKEELEAIASRSDVLHSTSNSVENGLVPEGSSTVDTNFANAMRDKAKELSSDVKSITQLYNEYAVPFELWEVLSLYLSISLYVCAHKCCVHALRYFSSL